MVVGAGFEWGYPYNCTEWAETFGLSFPLIDDAQYELTSALNITYIPFNVIIDQNMVVHHAAYGFDGALIASMIDSLLTELEALSILPGIPNAGAPLPDTILLASPYPNPFNPVVTIPYTLAQSGRIRLEVLDLNGRRIATLVDGRQTAGQHLATWEANGLASGPYFIRLQAAGETSSRIAILSK